ncbi:DMT family transporter [Methanobrevibacter sp. DSM 116169]|uniref:DMT family transporter n=1 Tax=Methanobrevibacter sp. DSM 116169 TaxID=3242727 RepID=UPI0038FD07E1
MIFKKVIFIYLNDKHMMMIQWIFLILAGIFEIGWALALKMSNGFQNILMSIVTIILMIVSLIFLSLAIKDIPMGTAYAIWTGIGAVGVSIAGIILFGEPKTFFRIFCIVVIVGGIVGLKLSS